MKSQNGFTLIELMIAVVVIGILSAVAVPSYMDYVKRGNAQEAPSNLLAMKTQAEQYYGDHPGTGYLDVSSACTTTYTPGTCFPCKPSASADVNTKYNFTYSCDTPTRTKDTFTITATGNSGTNIAGWTYTIDQAGTRASSGIGGASSTSCWITKSGGTC